VAAAVGRVSGEADILDARTGARLGRVAAAPGARAAQGGARVAGLAFLGGTAQGEPAQRLLACTAGGAASVHASERPAGEAQPAGDGGSDAAAAGCEWAAQASWAVGNEVLCMARTADADLTLCSAAAGCRRRFAGAPAPQAVDAADRHVAVGAKGAELGVWDLETRQRVFHGRGAKPNRIGLVDPAHNSAAAYLPEPDGNKVRAPAAPHAVFASSCKGLLLS